MKELSIEQKAKAYDEALERAREIKRTYPQDKVCETIFSELKESEDKDEEIKKALITLIQSCDKGCYTTISPSRIKKYTAWLEKQGEQKNKMNSYKITFEDVLALECSMKTAKITEGGDKLYEMLVHLYNKIHNAYLAEKQGKQKPTEWSKEDERLLNNMVIVIQDYYNKEDAQSLISWLKSLKDRAQPQNCIYYNPYKEVVESIAEMCKHYDKASHSGLRDFYDNVNVKCKDAKEYDSLFPQATWKPSDEQIRSLEYAIDYFKKKKNDTAYLESLYNDLKKLREE